MTANIFLNGLQYLGYILIFPGFLFCFLCGMLLVGIDRKLVARMQKRVGPPILQPFYDFFKLCGKETIIPAQASKATFLIAPLVRHETGESFFRFVFFVFVVAHGINLRTIQSLLKYSTVKDKMLEKPFGVNVYSSDFARFGRKAISLFVQVLQSDVDD